MTQPRRNAGALTGPDTMAKRKPIPVRPEGWKFHGAAGDFNVWHAGANDWRVTDGPLGDVVKITEGLGTAFAASMGLSGARKFEQQSAS